MKEYNLQSVVELQKVIQSNASKATYMLIDIAKKFAIDNNLVHRAVMLSREYVVATSDKARAQISKQMLELVDDIVKDYKDRFDSEQGKRKREVQRAMQEYYEKSEIKNDVVVAGKSMNMTYKKGNFSLSQVDVELRLGEITGVVGENANGKTTLFEIIVGNLAINSGELIYPYLHKNGTSNWSSIKKQIAYVPQFLPQWYGSLRDNLHFEAASHGIKGKKNMEEVEFIINRLELGDYLDYNWQQLSGGYKMRFALARCFVWKPKLLVLDEPLAHLDIKAQLTILNDIRDLSKSLKFPIAVIISSQHLHEIENVSDNLIFLQDGKAKFNGKISDLGKARKQNTFEFETSLSIQELEEKLMDFKYNSLTNNGLSYIITTSTKISQSDILKVFLAKNIEIDYFRDTSHSSKQLFT